MQYLSKRLDVFNILVYPYRPYQTIIVKENYHIYNNNTNTISQFPSISNIVKVGKLFV